MVVRSEVKHSLMDSKVMWQPSNSTGQVFTKSSPELGEEVNASDANMDGWKQWCQGQILAEEYVWVSVD
jgi:hypothetical protein